MLKITITRSDNGMWIGKLRDTSRPKGKKILGMCVRRSPRKALETLIEGRPFLFAAGGIVKDHGEK